jgi:hypothetical protein
MSDFLVLSGIDLKPVPVLETLGGRAINPRMWIVPWAGTAEQLYRHLREIISRILLVVALSADFVLLGI